MYTIQTTTLINSIASANGHHGIGWGIFAYVGIVLFLILSFVFSAKSGITSKTPQKYTTKMAEHLYLFMENVCVSVIGAHGRKYMPFLLSLWMFIFVSNVCGLIFDYTPTAELSLNLALSLIAILYVQHEGIKAHGLLGHLAHFAGPKLPLVLAMFITPLLFSIEMISELMKIASLSLRLYFNIHGGHLVKEVLDGLGGGIPVGGLLLPIKLLSCVVQALVFTMLTGVYLSVVTSHSDDHAEENHAEGHA